MSRLCLVLVLALSVSGCSLITVTPLKSVGTAGHQGHMSTDRSTRQRTTKRPRCTQSNWAAGVDMVAATTGSVYLGTMGDDTDLEYNIAIGAISIAALASMFYGFIETADCRNEIEFRGLERSGGTDWLYAPGIAFLVLYWIAMARSEAAGSSDQDLCNPGDVRTALCEDGVYSCSKRCRGRCSWHGGVKYRLAPCY